jgi:hypothetical protein
MLITNFAAGELSENLFGRIDIPQYFSGASRIENFDVIPTGGIKRRGGMERLTELSGEGRIIPFVVNRNEGFLLYLTDNKISIYKLIDGRITGSPAVYNSGANFQLYKTDEIDKVQYAQNFNTMILVHENCPPLEVVLNNGFLSVNTLSINFDVSVIAGKNITEQDKAPHEKDDEQYKTKGRLTTEGNYPSAVSFFHGRLVFAGTKNERQWVFASAVKQPDKNYNFSTYKTFLTEKREYSTLFGKIEKSDTSIISATPDSTYIINSFVKPPESYYVESQLYPAGTRIDYINLNEVKLTNGMKNPGTINDVEGIRAELLEKITAYDANNNFNYGVGFPFVVYTRDWRYKFYYPLEDVNVEERLEVKVICYVFANRIKIHTTGRLYLGSMGINPGGWNENYINISNTETIIPPEDVITLINTPNIISDRINTKINQHIEREKNRGHSPAVEFFYDNENEYPALQAASINKLFNNVLSTMYYELDTGHGTEFFYNYPEQLQQDVLARIVNTDHTYIAIYTREIISDSYPTPDCGFTFEIASDMNDAIKWLAVNKGLIIGTETAEWIIPPGVHATNVQAVLNSRYGSDGIQGTAIGDSTCFFQTGKKALVEYYIPQQDNNFRANNMALLSAQMLGESPAKEFDFVSSPYIKLIVTREDGTAVSLLYERGTGTFAWSRIITEGKICSTAVLPGSDGNDELYLVVRRNWEYFLEVLREDCTVFLDSFRNWNSVMENPPYSDEAVIHSGYIGYPYTSRVRSMPILANDKMKPNNIKHITIRFLDSFMPKLKALPNGKVDVITNDEPFSGVHKVPFPGVWDHDVCFEFIHDTPDRCRILAINAEVN